MAANVTAGRAILFYLAQALSELKSARVTARTSDTVFACGNLSETTDDTYNYGLLRKEGGTTYVVISDYVGSSKQFTVGAGLTIAVGDLVEFCWWNADKFSAARAAINEAIRLSWDYWHRQVIVEAASSGITLAAGDDEYDLPAACDSLMEVGTGANPIYWIAPVEPTGRVNYRVEGQTGALVLRFSEQYSREGTIADVFTGGGLALHYRTREPEIAETGDTQLPLGYFAVAAWIYARQALNDASRLDLQTASINLPQLEAAAQTELNRLGINKMLPSLLVAQGQMAAAAQEKK